VPEQGARYCIGVHYYGDYGYGASFATLRVYPYGELRFSQSDIELLQDDMWDVTCVSWPSGELDDLSGGTGTPRITRGYVKPWSQAHRAQAPRASSRDPE